MRMVLRECLGCLRCQVVPIFGLFPSRAQSRGPQKKCKYREMNSEQGYF